MECKSTENALQNEPFVNICRAKTADVIIVQDLRVTEWKQTTVPKVKNDYMAPMKETRFTCLEEFELVI